jgi:hypothetical protein
MQCQHKKNPRREKLMNNKIRLTGIGLIMIIILAATTMGFLNKKTTFTNNCMLGRCPIISGMLSCRKVKWERIVSQRSRRHFRRILKNHNSYNPSNKKPKYIELKQNNGNKIVPDSNNKIEKPRQKNSPVDVPIDMPEGCPGC